MKNLKKISLISVLLLTTFILSACSVSTKSDGDLSSGNIFISTDKGSVWRQISSIAGLGEDQSIAYVEVNEFFPDPSDHLAVYLASKENGLFYTYNIANGWNRANLNEKYIQSVAVDNQNKCRIYVASNNRLYRSDDCSRSFTQMYYDNSSDVLINSVVTDFYNPQNIYIATSRGEVIKSIDYGKSWRTIWRFDESVAKILLSPLDSRRMFVVTNSNKLYSFFSNTNTSVDNPGLLSSNFEATQFKDLNAVLTDLEVSKKFTNLVASKDGDIFLATSNMILRSPDDGVTWEKISLINPDKDSNILAMDINYNNKNEIYYASATTFFKSNDGGVTWNSKKLPTSWQASSIMVDLKDPNNVYLGAEKKPKEKGGGLLQVGNL